MFVLVAMVVVVVVVVVVFVCLGLLRGCWVGGVLCGEGWWGVVSHTPRHNTNLTHRHTHPTSHTQIGTHTHWSRVSADVIFS